MFASQSKYGISFLWHSVRFIVLYWVSWIFIFQLARVFFLLANYSSAQELGFSTSLATMWHGLQMDISMATYFLLPVILYLLIAIFISSLLKPFFLKIYTILLTCITWLLCFMDIGLFKAWGFRLDDTAFKYLSNPREVWASISHLPVWWILLGYVVLCFISWRSWSMFFKRQFNPAFLEGNKLKLSLFCFLLLAVSIIPIRGGLQLAPLNQSSVYFSSSQFANLSAINASWNFMHAITHRKNSGKNPYLFTSDEQAQATKDSLFISQGRIRRIVKDIEKPNVLFIIWESLTKKVIDLDYEGKSITPHFNQLKTEGVYFSRIYASGDRTDKGIVALLSGYPAQPMTSIIKIPSKAAKLPTLGKLFEDRGYNTAFYYGGELEFANMKAYLMQNEFERYISKEDYAEKDQNSKWGAHDGAVMERFKQDLQNVSSPFFYTWLTLSSHEPFETPEPPVFSNKGDESLFLNSIHYTDKVLGNFITWCKTQNWWENTVVVIVADHGHRLPKAKEKDDDFEIPLLFTGGAIKEKSIITHTGSQTDIATTIWAQVSKEKINPFQWGKNLLDTSAAHWAYFSFNNGFGFITDSSGYIYDNVGNRVIESKGRVMPEQLKQGKAMLQWNTSDYLSK